jgi:hypothetical protein
MPGKNEAGKQSSENEGNKSMFYRKHNNTCVRDKSYKNGYSIKKYTISGTGEAIWSKTNLGPTAHYHP